jgi:hypothetical protein
MMEFPPGIETGDGAALNGPQIQVSNAVYNKIRLAKMRLDNKIMFLFCVTLFHFGFFTTYTLISHPE